MITPDQIRAARALKNWSQSELANRTGLTAPTIANIELGKQKPSAETLGKIIEAFKFSGIGFTDKGVEKIDDVIVFIDDIKKYYQVLIDALSVLKKDDELLLLGADEKRSPREVIDLTNKLADKGVNIRAIICEGDIFTQLESLENYRAMPKEYFKFEDVIAIYGDKVATVLSDKMGGSEKIMILKNKHNATNYKRIFKFFWDHSKPLEKNVDVKNYKNPMLKHYTEEEIQKIAKEKPV